MREHACFPPTTTGIAQISTGDTWTNEDLVAVRPTLFHPIGKLDRLTATFSPVDPQRFDVFIIITYLRPPYMYEIMKDFKSPLLPHSEGEYNDYDDDY